MRVFFLEWFLTSFCTFHIIFSEFSCVFTVVFCPKNQRKYFFSSESISNFHAHSLGIWARRNDNGFCIYYLLRMHFYSFFKSRLLVRLFINTFLSLLLRTIYFVLIYSLESFIFLVYLMSVRSFVIGNFFFIT